MATFQTPLLHSDANPDGVCLEELLEQLLDELRVKNAAVPSRETSMVMTKLEEALLWQVRRGQVRGGFRVVGDPTKAAGHTYVPRRFIGDPLPSPASCPPGCLGDSPECVLPCGAKRP